MFPLATLRMTDRPLALGGRAPRFNLEAPLHRGIVVDGAVTLPPPWPAGAALLPARGGCYIFPIATPSLPVNPSSYWEVPDGRA